MIEDKAFLDGSRTLIKDIYSGVSAFLSGYALHLGVFDFIFNHGSLIIEYGWIIALFIIMIVGYDFLKGTRHFRKWGFLIILFAFGLFFRAVLMLVV
jgi:hypothetical protein